MPSKKNISTSCLKVLSNRLALDISFPIDEINLVSVPTVSNPNNPVVILLSL